ncbi:MAG: glycosyltransferase family 2 protein [Pseudomonadota bacterium]
MNETSPIPAAGLSTVPPTGKAAPRIAVLVPCYDEEVTIATVVAGFQAALPEATVYVYDNNSRDGTVAAAQAAGAVVRRETRQGKGEVVRRMFADIEADVYVLVDGDATYDAAAAPDLVARLIDDGLDMVTGCRIAPEGKGYRPGHRFGNWMLTGLVAMIFGRSTRDMLSGYRIFSRRFVKTFPALSRGFEIETELTVHALELRMPVADLDTAYADRPEGSVSKLGTFRDGLRILRIIADLVRDERPLPFFGAIALLLALLSVGIMVPVVLDYLATGLVERFPTAILASALMVVAVLSFFAGLILDTVTQGRRELKRLAYLDLPGPHAGGFRLPAGASSDEPRSRSGAA